LKKLRAERGESVKVSERRKSSGSDQRQAARSPEGLAYCDGHYRTQYQSRESEVMS